MPESYVTYVVNVHKIIFLLPSDPKECSCSCSSKVLVRNKEHVYKCIMFPKKVKTCFNN